MSLLIPALKVILIIILVIIIKPSCAQGDWKIKGGIIKLRGDRIIQISEDGFGNIWTISTSNSGEYAYKGYLNRVDTNYILDDFKNNQEIYDKKFMNLVPGKDGEMFCVGVSSGDAHTYKYYNDHWENITHDFKKIKKEYNIPRKVDIVSVSVDSLDRIWVETKNGILLCDNKSFARYFEKTNFAGRILNIYPNKFYVDQFTITNKGVFRFEENKFEKIREIAAKEYYNYIGVDQGKRSWFVKTIKNVASYLTYYDGVSWKDFDNPIGIYPYLPTFYFRPDNSFWYMNNQSIKYIKDDKLTILPIDTDKIPNKFQFEQMVFDNNNNIYISCNINTDIGSTTYRWEKHGGFLIHYNGEKFHYYVDEDKMARLRQTYIRDMIVDSKNNLWIITGFPKADILAGENSALIIKKSHDSIELFGKSKGFDARFYTTVFEDKHGKIWIGSSNDGIYMYDTENK